MADPVAGSAAYGGNMYDQWLQSEGVPVVRGLAVEDLRSVSVAPWERKGALGAIVKLDGSENVNDAYVLELPRGTSTRLQRHLFEELVYILEGHGATTVSNDRGDETTFEWGAGSLFSLPLNAYHRFHNGSGVQSVRYVAVTLAPLFMNLFHNTDFIFNCPFDFTDRFTGKADHFSGEGKSFPGRIWETNFIPDVLALRLQEWKERGAGGSNIMLEIGDGSMGSHISEFPVGTYKKAHRHGPGAHVIILAGEGYSLMWPEGGEVRRVDWRPGSMLVPPDRWFHQHFNVGETPARYLALRGNGRKWRVFKDPERAVETSIKLGGDQIEYEDQEPSIHETFVNECKRRNVDVRMSSVLPRS